MLVAQVEMRVEAKSGRFKMISNCNYVIQLCQQLKLALVSVQGVDIVDGKEKLVLAIAWQLWRLHITRHACCLRLARLNKSVRF